MNPAQERDAEQDLALCEAATPGEWVKTERDRAAMDECAVCGNDMHDMGAPTVSAKVEGEQYALAICRMTWAERGDADGDFIAAARTALPYWLARAKELTREVEFLRLYFAEAERLLFVQGDPFNGDDWEAMRIVRQALGKERAELFGVSERLRQDAERYRWLRSDGLQHINWGGLTCDTCDVGLDYAIDQALAEPPQPLSGESES